MSSAEPPSSAARPAPIAVEIAVPRPGTSEISPCACSSTNFSIFATLATSLPMSCRSLLGSFTASTASRSGAVATLATSLSRWPTLMWNPTPTCPSTPTGFQSRGQHARPSTPTAIGRPLREMVSPTPIVNFLMAADSFLRILPASDCGNRRFPTLLLAARRNDGRDGASDDHYGAAGNADLRQGG